MGYSALPKHKEGGGGCAAPKVGCPQPGGAAQSPPRWWRPRAHLVLFQAMPSIFQVLYSCGCRVFSSSSTASGISSGASTAGASLWLGQLSRTWVTGGGAPSAPRELPQRQGAEGSPWLGGGSRSWGTHKGQGIEDEVQQLGRVRVL